MGGKINLVIVGSAEGAVNRCNVEGTVSRRSLEGVVRRCSAEGAVRRCNAEGAVRRCSNYSNVVRRCSAEGTLMWCSSAEGTLMWFGKTRRPRCDVRTDGQTSFHPVPVSPLRHPAAHSVALQETTFGRLFRQLQPDPPKR